MRQRILTAGWAVLAAFALAACEGQPTDDESDDADNTVSESPAPTPKSVRYPDAELVAALPSGRVQLHGRGATARCRDMSQPCKHADEAGLAYVHASKNGDRNDVDVSVSVDRRWTAATWREEIRDCPRGKIDKPLVWHPEIQRGAYAPGERGTSRRSPTEIGAWTGFTCEKKLVYLWPKNEQSGLEHRASVVLNNGLHVVQAHAPELTLADALAREYLRRLDGGRRG